MRHAWRRLAGLASAVLLFLVAVATAASAQESPRVWRIGFLGPASGSPNDPRIEALRRGFRELGYTEGRNLAFEFRWAGGHANRLAQLAAELARLKVDTIVTQGTQATEAARRAVPSIPIVFAVAGDPVGTGLVASLARPGGNVTGLTDIAPEIIGKRLELLREAVSGIARIAVLSNPSNPTASPLLKDTEVAGRSMGISVQSVELPDVSQLDAAFATMMQSRAQAVVVLSDTSLYGRRQQIAELATKHRVPCIGWTSEFAESGCFMAYGANVVEMHRRAAGLVDRILKGASPGTIPVEQPTTFELVLNLKTAKALGLRVPATMLARADRLIE